MRVTHQLIAITIARHNDHPKTNINGLISHRCNHIICFKANEFGDGDSHCCQEFFDDSHLLPQNIGRGLALRLISGLSDVPKCRLRSVKGNNDSVWTVILEQGQNHRRHSVHGIGHLPTGCDHVRRDAIEGSIGQ